MRTVLVFLKVLSGEISMAKQGLIKDQSERSAALAVTNVEGLLRQQWSTGRYPKCSHQTWESLAKAVGLNSNSPKQIGAIKQWVHKNKLPEPRPTG